MRTGIIYSSDPIVVDTCFDSCSEIGMGLIKQTDFTNFIFELQQDLIDLIIFDSTNQYADCLKQVKIIRRIKSKIPLIVISDDIESIEGGKIYEEGIFHLAQKPIHKKIFKEIIKASINSVKEAGQ
jgi:DNA-binding response OmpR family regulator